MQYAIGIMVYYPWVAMSLFFNATFTATICIFSNFVQCIIGGNMALHLNNNHILYYNRMHLA